MLRLFFVARRGHGGASETRMELLAASWRGAAFIMMRTVAAENLCEFAGQRKAQVAPTERERQRERERKSKKGGGNVADRFTFDDNSNRNKTTLRMRDKFIQRKETAIGCSGKEMEMARGGGGQLVYLALVALSFDFSHFDGQLSQQPGQPNKQTNPRLVVQ